MLFEETAMGFVQLQLFPDAEGSLQLPGWLTSNTSTY